ncbi:MAG: heme-binding protein [Flavobacteriaceae bacterium TMED42]|nr:MAG: heme-binding protein [Flavobacteriaceae bacterium TMED42]
MKRFLFFFMLCSTAMAQTEIQSYSVIQNIAEAEIRFYPPVMMAKHTSKREGSGFGKLFGYISGNNTNNTKIAMTTPVHMEKKTGENSMTFVLPRKFTGDNTPQPNDTSLSVFEDKGGYFAAIKYSGYTSTIKEKQHTEILQKLLQKENIISSGSPKILLYDSPYKVINRRNEILIPITFKDEKNK